MVQWLGYIALTDMAGVRFPATEYLFHDLEHASFILRTQRLYMECVHFFAWSSTNRKETSRYILHLHLRRLEIYRRQIVESNECGANKSILFLFTVLRGKRRRWRIRQRRNTQSLRFAVSRRGCALVPRFRRSPFRNIAVVVLVVTRCMMNDERRGGASYR